MYLDLEMDITYACNLRCKNCNRMCRQKPAPTAFISLEAVQRLKDSGIPVRRLGIVGGEPLLHPRLRDIIRLSTSFAKHVDLVTNGTIPFDRVELGLRPEDGVLNSNKGTDYTGAFEPINRAPKDFVDEPPEFYRKQCEITTRCGRGLTPYGTYYICPVAGAIDRCFGYNLGLATPQELLMQHNQDLQAEVFCALCGHFGVRYLGFPWTTEEAISPSWASVLGR